MHIDTGDTAWLLVSAAMVMLMTPALAMFYGGMVQGKNVLSTFMHSFYALGLVTIQWVVIGYSLAFGATHAGLIGGFDFIGLHGVAMDGAGRSVPHLSFMMYQCMFAVITPALISGAYAERLKFSAYVVFTLAWTTLVYDPIAHWVWGTGGWLAEKGALDFAGGTVVHVSSGAAALIVALKLGKRRGYPATLHPPHNLTMTLIGAGILWFGWFGFNAGSALGANGLAALAFTNTHIAAAGGAIAWTMIERARLGKVTALGMASGLVAGLVGITPAAGFVSPMSALLIGALAAIACFAAVSFKSKLGYDDALDAFGVHGIGGALGALLTGVLATKALSPDNVGGGVIEGHWHLLGVQALGLAAAIAWSMAITWLLLTVIDKTLGLRVDAETESDGLDGHLHGEAAYGTTAGSGHH